MDADAIWYFAYGSNMSPAIFLERRKMRPLAAHPARLDDYRLRFDVPVGSGERGVANLAPEAGSQVWGVAYLLSFDDCTRLDRSEGVPAGLYTRIAVQLSRSDAALAGFAYRSSLVVEGRKPSERYLRLLLEGARHHGLPATYVTALEALERAIDERLSVGAPSSVR